MTEAGPPTSVVPVSIAAREKVEFSSEMDSPLTVRPNTRSQLKAIKYNKIQECLTRQLLNPVCFVAGRDILVVDVTSVQ